MGHLLQCVTKIYSDVLHCKEHFDDMQRNTFSAAQVLLQGVYAGLMLLNKTG